MTEILLVKYMTHEFFQIENSLFFDERRHVSVEFLFRDRFAVYVCINFFYEFWG